MTEVLVIHPDNPQSRLIKQVATVLENHGVIVYPTDSAYALGCQVGNKAAADHIRRIRQLDKHHNFTLMCRDLSELGLYAHVSNPNFRLLKANTPGPYTFVLRASNEVPRRLQHPKRKTVGLRIPDNKIAQAILTELGQPMMSVSLILPGQEEPLAYVDDIEEKLAGQIDLIVDGGFCGTEPTTVIEMENGNVKLIRKGKGDPSPFRL